MSSMIDGDATALAAALRAARPALDADGAGAALAAALAAARAAWPDVAVAAPAFVAFVAARLPAGHSAVAGLVALRTSDLYLACACSAADPAAVRAFDRSFLPMV